MQGWIKLHRKIQEHWLYQEKRKFSRFEAWIDLLMMVNHEDAKVVLGNELIEVKRGQRITSIRQLCDRWGWSNTKVTQFLKLLESDGMATVKSDSKKTVITIDNYDFYQGREDKKTTDKQQENDEEATQKHTNKNVKNDKNEKNNIVVAERQAQNDEIDILLNRYIQLRGSGFSYSPIDVEAAKHILSSGVPLNSALTYMEELMQSYIPKYPGDKINSLKYCVGYILDRYYKEKAKEGANNVLSINRGSYGRTKSQNQPKPEPILGEDFVGRVRRNRA